MAALWRAASAEFSFINLWCIPVIASGGVSKLADIAALKAINVEGVIVGKSLYENTVRLPEAIALAAEN